MSIILWYYRSSWSTWKLWLHLHPMFRISSRSFHLLLVSRTFIMPETGHIKMYLIFCTQYFFHVWSWQEKDWLHLLFLISHISHIFLFFHLFIHWKRTAYNPACVFKVLPCSFILESIFFDWWTQVTSINIQLASSTLLYGPTKLTQTPPTPKLGYAGGKILHLQM